jgi:cysteine-rich repeat protein
VNCKLARCGDGVHDPLEQCDDGNTTAGDGCRADCAGRWTEMPTDTFAYLSAVWGSAPDDVFAVGGGKILHYDGSTWTSQAVPVPAQGYTAVWGTGATNVYALGDKRLDHYDGTSWSASYTPPFQGLALWGSSPNDIWIGGGNDSAAVFLAHWNGSAWIVDTSQPAAVVGLWGTGSNDVYALWDQDQSGNGSNVFLFHYGGATWQPVTGTSSMMLADAFRTSLIYGTSATDVFAFDPSQSSAPGPVMHRRIGTGWTTVACCDEIQQGANGLGGVAGDILLVGNGGRILRNDGATWSISRSPTSATLRAVWSSSVNRAFVVGDNGTILY